MAPGVSTAAALMADDRVPPFCNYIGGEWTGAHAEATSDDINPADSRDVVGRFPLSSATDAAEAVHAAERAFAAWRTLPISSRAKILNRAADHLEAHCEEYAREMTREMGKLLALAKDEFLRSAQTLRFYAVEGQTLAGETFHNDDGDMEVYTRREPLGAVSVITPWNFPVSIPARKIAPALMTGNTVVFKPSSDAPLSGLRLVEAFAEAGIPKGVLNLITGPSSDVGRTITTAPPVRAISFTGSTAAGEHIHRSVPFTTRTQMELGGKNPLIVMEDADLDKAVDLTVKGGLSLTGQACTGTSLVLVIKDVKDAFLRKLVAKVKGLKIGNGLLPGIDIGPLATARQLQTVLSYIEIGKREGTLLCGGERLNGPEYEHGYFVSPAIFADVSNDARIAREEIFGPVIAVIEVENYADAIAKANSSEYGLSAAIVTGNPRIMHDFVRDVESGTVKINRTTTGNLINAPFGGLKRSSTSTFREAGRTGLEFYTQIKTVYRGC